MVARRDDSAGVRLLAERESERPARKRRPDQLVLVSFDDCGDLGRWATWSEFASRHPSVAFTFFVSGASFVPDEAWEDYRGPGRRPGAAEIDFGGTPDDVRQRLEYASALAAKGHEIASHAVGHFNGQRWTRRDWLDEFDAFDACLAKAARSLSPRGAAQPLAAMKGFRAPYLGHGDALFEALAERGFRYDASAPNQQSWGARDHNGLWRFGLSAFALEGFDRLTTGMDFNVWQAHQQVGWSAEPGPLHGWNMLESYLAAFRTRYLGDRRPLQIGQHFLGFSKGAYDEALMRFIEIASTLPHVRFVTYSALADTLEANAPSGVAARAGAARTSPARRPVETATG